MTMNKESIHPSSDVPHVDAPASPGEFSPSRLDIDEIPIIHDVLCFFYELIMNNILRY
jgi:hypothetical protein